MHAFPTMTCCSSTKVSDGDPKQEMFVHDRSLLRTGSRRWATIGTSPERRRHDTGRRPQVKPLPRAEDPHHRRGTPIRRRRRNRTFGLTHDLRTTTSMSTNSRNFSWTTSTHRSKLSDSGITASAKRLPIQKRKEWWRRRPRGRQTAAARRDHGDSPLQSSVDPQSRNRRQPRRNSSPPRMTSRG